MRTTTSGSTFESTTIPSPQLATFTVYRSDMTRHYRSLFEKMRVRFIPAGCHQTKMNAPWRGTKKRRVVSISARLSYWIPYWRMMQMLTYDIDTMATISRILLDYSARIAKWWEGETARTFQVADGAEWSYASNVDGQGGKLVKTEPWKRDWGPYSSRRRQAASRITVMTCFCYEGKLADDLPNNWTLSYSYIAFLLFQHVIPSRGRRMTWLSAKVGLIHF